MASDSAAPPDRPPGAVADLVAFTQKELQADAERHAKVSASGSGDVLPKESQTGCTLDLSHRKINALPPEVIALIKDRVERLALSHNPSITLPFQLVQCERLRYLNLRWNQLTAIPEPVLQLSKLEILDISKNKVTVIPDDIKNLTSLKFLAVARNQIKRLPPALGEMASLSKLKFDDNPLEYPPQEVLQPQPTTTIASEKEKEVCQQVKRYLKAAAMREKLRTNSSEDLSESNVETPRPPRRTVTGGRFPVRPSVSGIENVDDLKPKSATEPAPPIPLKSHARGSSTHSSTRRPFNSPVAGGELARTRSDTASSSASVRSRRQGFVPRKNGESNAFPGYSPVNGDRKSQGSTNKVMHSRGNSSVSTLNGLLAAGSGGESSSGAVSPVDTSHSRRRPVPRLSSLPENRNSHVRTSNSFKASRRLMVVLFELHRPISTVVIALKDGTPKKTALERQIFNADTKVQELDRLVTRLDSSLEEGNGDEGDSLKAIISASILALKAYTAIVKELKQTSQRMLLVTETFQLRSLMNQLYYTMVESRNICTVLGFLCKPHAAKDTPRAPSNAWSSRTVTPTQPPRPVNTRRLRGATILQNMGIHSTIRAVPPPMPSHVHGSRTNTINPYPAGPTPRTAETFAPPLPGNMPSRQNTLRGVMDDTETDEHFEKIFLKLRSACDLIYQTIPRCRDEFCARKDHANSVVQPRNPGGWANVINRCDVVMTAGVQLRNALKGVKLKDPGLRHQKDFWQLCDGLVKAWADFMVAVQDLARQRLELTAIKTLLRPVQKVMKDVSKTISESPLYLQASRAGPGMPGLGLAPAFPSTVQTPFGYPSGSRSGYITPNPATPLSAALGPAVQATVALTPNAIQPPPDVLYHAPPGQHHGHRITHERVDTVMQQPGSGRR